MSQSEAPKFSWDDSTAEAGQDGDDFLLDVQAQGVPNACSLDNPECEACQ